MHDGIGVLKLLLLIKESISVTPEAQCYIGAGTRRVRRNRQRRCDTAEEEKTALVKRPSPTRQVGGRKEAQENRRWIIH